MKFFVIYWIIVFLGCGEAERPQKDDELENNLMAFFEMWLKGGPSNWLPLPRLNEVTIPDQEGSYKDTGIKLSYATSEMKLTGLPQSYIRDLVAEDSETSLAARGVLVAPSLSLFAEKYKIDGQALFFYPIKGQGEMSVNFQDCVLGIDFELGTNGTSMWVEKLLFRIDVDKITIYLTGTSAFITNALNIKASSLFEKHRKEMETSLTESAVPLLNSYLIDLSPAQLLEILSSISRPT